MSLTTEQLQAVMTGTESDRTEALRQLLAYPVKQRDPEGSQFWFLRPGADRAEAEEMCPVAVGFYSQLNQATDREIKTFLTEPEQQREIYGHYTSRVNEQKPVMYLLLPEQACTGRVALVLPTERGLRQGQIETFSWDERELLGRLSRLQQGQLPIATKALFLIPLVEWAFYEAAQTAWELARSLANVTRRMEQVIPRVYEVERAGGYLHELLSSFQRELLPTLQLTSANEKDYSFADIYAQTIAYGLFTARVFGHAKDCREGREKQTYFNRQDAWQQLPETNPFLRRLFRDVSERSPEDLGEELSDAIAEIFGILRAAKMDAILSDFRQKMNREDIVIRFYEDFLAAYKSQMRESRGVYYTPEPVVSYMVRSVDQLLQDKFNKPLGLADPEAMILDPACGTGTFLLQICQLIHQRFLESPAALTEGLVDKSWSSYVRERLLPRIFGFELLMAPYAIAHLKLGLFLEETGYQFDGGKRLGVYLTNTLDDAARKSETLFEEFIAEEADRATEIKRDLPIMVVIGNPPYSANSANTGKWVTNLVRDSYYPKDAIKEQNPKLLLDDYVKFIRFSQWRIEQSGYGILSFITNHGYLDNPTFRRMRQSLMNTFDDVYTLDLHGNSKKKEKCPDGSKDENVFDIQQGVSIGICLKQLGNRQNNNIWQGDLWGNRDSKYAWLGNNSVVNNNWNNITPPSPFYLFVNQDIALLPEYQQGWKITDIMPVNSTGVKSHRDHFVFDFELLILQKRIADFINLDISDAKIAEVNELCDTRDWKLSQKRRSLATNNQWSDYFTQCYYRPFDLRFYYYHKDVVELPKHEVMHHMIEGNNLGLLFMRQVAVQNDYSHFMVTCYTADNRAFYSNKGAMQLAPLYIYPDTDNPQQLALEERRPNFSQDFLNTIIDKLGYTPTPEAIFHYIYAIFYSPTYRSRYTEFLKTDFPRVPITSNPQLFRQLAAYGEELVALHLMQSPKLNNLITKFSGSDSDRQVDPGHPKYSEGDVVINRQGDRFTGVPEPIWNFYVGGYQPCQKWLKDRKGRTLSPEDITHYQRIVVALQETIGLMQQIDQAIPGWPLE